MIKNYFILVWLSGARPPVHPEKMKGVQAFSTAYDAGVFFSKLPGDSEFISLTMIEEQNIDVSDIIKDFLNENRPA